MPTLRWLTRNEDVRAAKKVTYCLLEDVGGWAIRKSNLVPHSPSKPLISLS